MITTPWLGWHLDTIRGQPEGSVRDHARAGPQAPKLRKCVGVDSSGQPIFEGQR